MSLPVSQSITRKSASNLALAFILLPREKREAMSVLYAFCREIDDVADNASLPVADRRHQLAEWRADLASACTLRSARLPVNRELIPLFQRYGLALSHFDELIQGVEMDLEVDRYATYADLETYCYRVASVVGLLSIEIFGYRNPACREYAIQLGKALQFTNILRDVRNDAERGRIYLPNEALAEARLTAEDILKHQYSERFRALAEAFAQRAHAFYRRAADVLPPEDRRSMIAAELMGSVYWRLLRKIEACSFRVMEPEPVRVSRPVKLLLVLRTWLSVTAGMTAPNYGRA